MNWPDRIASLEGEVTQANGAVQVQQRIFSLIQERLLEAAEDPVGDAEHLNDLSAAASYAAEAIASLKYEAVSE